MSNFAILRFAKLKTFQEIGKVGSHNHRSRPVKNADPELTKHNLYDPDGSKLVDKVKKLLPEKQRKNGVLAVEAIMTFSPEWWQEKKNGLPVEKHAEALKDWTDQSLRWLEKTMGQGNVVDWALHLDETTPHLQCVFVPIDPKGKVNCRHFLGGREKLIQLQDSYYESVKGFKLRRGVKGSKAKHTSIKHYYTQVNKSERSLRAKLKDIDQRFENLGKPGFLGFNDWYQLQVLPLFRDIRSLFKTSHTHKEEAQQEQEKLKNENVNLKRQLFSLENRFSSLAKDIGIKDWKTVSKFPDSAKSILKSYFQLGLKKVIQEETAKEALQVRTTAVSTQYLPPTLQKLPEPSREPENAPEPATTTTRTVLKPRF